MSWVKVQFYGRLPEGQAIVNVDLVEVAQRLGETFGFEVIDGLSATVAYTSDMQPDSEREEPEA